MSGFDQGAEEHGGRRGGAVLGFAGAGRDGTPVIQPRSGDAWEKEEDILNSPGRSWTRGSCQTGLAAWEAGRVAAALGGQLAPVALARRGGVRMGRQGMAERSVMTWRWGALGCWRIESRPEMGKKRRN